MATRIQEFLASDFSGELRTRFGLAPDDRSVVLCGGDCLINQEAGETRKRRVSLIA